ncbi:ubiquinol-cytochrome-c reductase complex assembly factor 2 [Trichonephila inaurata madagascariensis]|uniref:Mitochondrial nucleoid factor 1 n=1 Tax=Trichonephila inaurata madagascariensis TaxID=2747483 RepID=A0A8X6MC01_9ARAC|nr:ubiquinol-cytochrome-c reductase complex assembly factor 2 [Trichonephila inaurata madagascariensis]
MAGALYKNYLRVCEKWGVDASKKGRDLGEFIRQQVAKEFAQGEATNIRNLEECEQKLESLNRLASNHYGKQFLWINKGTVTGMSLDECRRVLSTEGLKMINEMKLSFIDRVKGMIK